MVAKIEKMLSMILTQEHEKQNREYYHTLKNLFYQLASPAHKWISK